MASVVTFGEVMLRLSPSGGRRIVQSQLFDAHFGGAEANVAVTLAQLGVSSAFVSAVPANDLGQAAINSMRAWGVEASRIQRLGERLGIYFLEHGASQRPSNVTYDRAGSAFSQVEPGSLDWDQIFDGSSWFHFTGITPALSGGAATAVAEGVSAAKRLGLTVSCDLNYRKKLWSREKAEATMTPLMANVDVCIANEEDAESVFGIKAAGASVESGQLERGRYEQVARELTERFGFTAVGVTLRESFSASRNGWSGMLFTEGRAYFSRRYEIDVVDRIGSGDSFAAGLVYGSLLGKGPLTTIEFAAALGCLAHSVPGDYGIVSVAEVEGLLSSGGSGRVVR